MSPINWGFYKIRINELNHYQFIILSVWHYERNKSKQGRRSCFSSNSMNILIYYFYRIGGCSLVDTNLRFTYKTPKIQTASSSFDRRITTQIDFDPCFTILHYLCILFASSFCCCSTFVLPTSTSIIYNTHST
jgi:hypothetical protein